ncbi:MAG: hypothetical protein SFV19_06675 [Rhodospirillaceae bacterium]|nr:hypothetical protein [Rhodospirillaceae bacterium]
MTATQQARAVAPAPNAMPAYRLHARDGAAKTSTYVKDDPRTQIRTYLIFEADGTVRVRKTQRVDRVLDANAVQAGTFSGYRGKDWVCTSRVPLVEWTKLLTACGAAPGRAPEYDRERMRKILNDADYRAFKTVPGRV